MPGQPEPEFRIESWSAKGDVKELRKAYAGFYPQVEQVLAACPDVHKWAIVDRAALDRWTERNVTLLGDACHLLGRPLVSAAVLRFEGQLSTFKSHLGAPHPCHRCLHPEPPPDGLVPSCSEAGVLGAVTGVMGTLQATEVLKEILGIGEGMSGRLLLWDALDARFRSVKLRRDPGCALCGEAATIRDLSGHDAAAPLACTAA